MALHTIQLYMVTMERSTPRSQYAFLSRFVITSAILTFPQTPMRIPEGVKLYKETLPSIFPGLVVTSDLSNRTNVVSASTSWTIWYDSTTGENRRSSAADALLWAADQQRPSLTVLAEHKVAKVLFDSSLTAKGVTFGTNTSGSWNVYAKKEVILAAGSLASAPVLERSGVGSKSVLKAAGVKQLVDLPGVGANLCVRLCPLNHGPSTLEIDGIPF